MNSSLLSRLNPEQLAAATLQAQSTLIIELTLVARLPGTGIYELRRT